MYAIKFRLKFFGWLEFCLTQPEFGTGLREIQQLLDFILTAGGLLVSLDDENADAFIDLMEKKGIPVAMIGEIVSEREPRILVR